METEYPNKKVRVLAEGVRPLDELDVNTDIGLLRMMTTTTKTGASTEPRGQFALSEPTAFKMLTDLEQAADFKMEVRGTVVPEIDPEIAEAQVAAAVEEMEAKELEAVQRLFGAEGLDDDMLAALEAAGYVSGSDGRSETPDLLDGIDLSAWDNILRKPKRTTKSDGDVIMVDADEMEGVARGAVNGLGPYKKPARMSAGSGGSSTLVTPKSSPAKIKVT